MSDSVSGIEPLDRRINRWAAMISDCSGSTLAGILLNAENVFHAVRDLGSYGPGARRMLQTKARLSQPMMSKLEAIGRHAALFRLQADNLPPSVSSLYALAQRPGHEMIRAIAMNLRDKTRAEIKGLFAPARPARTTQPLMTIVVPAGVQNATKLQLIADIEAALDRIGEERKIGLSVRSRRPGRRRNHARGRSKKLENSLFSDGKLPVRNR